MTRILLLAAAYFATGWLGLQIPYAGSHITLVWLPTGIAVAALLRWGNKVWPGVFMGAVLVNLAIGSSTTLAASIAIGNTLGPLLVSALLGRVDFHPAFDRKRDVRSFIVFAGLGMAISATSGVASLHWAGLVPLESIGSAWSSWWMGDTVGVLLAAPLLLNLTRKNIESLVHERKELLLWMLVAVPVAWLAFIHQYEQAGRALPLAFLTLPLFVWAALRFGSIGAALAALGFSVTAAWSTATGQGFALLDDHSSLFLLWSYMATTVLTGLLITALQAERTRVESALRQNEEKLRGLYETSPLGFALTDMQGRYIEFNQAFQNICGYSAEELQSLDYWKLTPRKYEADEAQQLISLERTGRYGPYEKEYIHKDGSPIPIQLNGMLIVGSDGQNYIWSIVQDISARKQAEANLQISAVAFEAQEGIMITDANGVILRVNQAFTEITGYSTEEAVGQTPRLLKSGRHDAEFYAAMWKSIRQTGIWQGEIWDRRKNGEIFPKWMTISAVKGTDGVTTHYVGTQIDISERKAAEDEIKHLAFYDALTNLPNRRLLLDRLRQSLATNIRGQRLGALLFIDLDNFKTLNDTLGHDIGDLLLQQVAQRLSSCIREGDTAARLGGDEFIIMLEDLGAETHQAATTAELVGTKILTALRQTFMLNRHEYHVTSSIGVTLFGDQDVALDELLIHADLAMYQAKAAGRNDLRFYDHKMQATITTRVALETDLRQGLQKKEFFLHYQPQVDMHGRVMGAEVLIRWQHPQRGLVSPADFIPIAEDTGLILPIGYWVLETTCTQLATWANQPEMTHLTLAVNVSASQFLHPDFVDQVKAVIEHTGANPLKLKLELTESMLLDDVESIITKMKVLKVYGVGFSLDDFGTGYSSLSYLKRLPLDQLKIDQSFVRDVLSDPDDAAIARTIVALGQSLRLNVIAEGVETVAQRDFLEQNGCHTYQGYLFSRPVPIEAFERLQLGGKLS